MSASPARTSLDRYLDALDGTTRLDAAGERALAARYRDGDARAGQALVEANLPFVVHVARRYRRWGVPLEDLVQQGNLGLLRAARRFDEAKGCRLVTYAAYWIRAEIRDYVVHNYRIVRLGTTRTERQAIRMFRRGDAADADTLAAESGMPLPRARKLLPLLEGRDRSLDAPAREGLVSAVEAMPGADPTPETALADRELLHRRREVVAAALAELPPRERRIVEARFLASDEAPTLKALGRELGLTKERVRQLQERALARLRAALEAERLAA